MLNTKVKKDKGNGKFTKVYQNCTRSTITHLEFVLIVFCLFWTMCHTFSPGGSPGGCKNIQRADTPLRNICCCTSCPCKCLRFTDIVSLLHDQHPSQRGMQRASAILLSRFMQEQSSSQEPNSINTLYTVII